MNPLWMLSYLPNMPASHIAIFNDLRGPNNSLTMREAAGLMAIREAVQTIERGHADRMIAGATGTRIHSFKTVHALQQEQLANPELPPAEACRPFDARAHWHGRRRRRRGDSARGIRGGEGARGDDLRRSVRHGERAALERTSRRPARRRRWRTRRGRRSRRPVWRRATWGTSTRMRLGTTAGDAEEAAALANRVWAAAWRRSRSSAAKSYFGNLGAGSGVVETIASVLALAQWAAVPDAELRDARSRVSA